MDKVAAGIWFSPSKMSYKLEAHGLLQVIFNSGAGGAWVSPVLQGGGSWVSPFLFDSGDAGGSWGSLGKMN